MRSAAWLAVCVFGLSACEPNVMLDPTGGSSTGAGAGAPPLDGGADATGASAATGGGGVDTTSGAGGAGGAPALPLAPCFPAATDDFSDPQQSAAQWTTEAVSFEGGVARLGGVPEELSILYAEAVAPADCFISFRLGPLGPDALAYLLLKPEYTTEALIDVDVEATSTDVSLYVRSEVGEWDVVEAPRPSDLLLLILRGDTAELYAATPDEAEWVALATHELPPFPSETRGASFVKYDGLAPFDIDDVNVLPPELIATFPDPLAP